MLALMGGGVLVLVIFCVVETKVAEPMFQLTLFRVPRSAPATWPACSHRWGVAA